MKSKYVEAFGEKKSLRFNKLKTVLNVVKYSEAMTLNVFVLFGVLLFGERPFWWIGESRLFVNKQPKIHQFPSTCETGPGSPSGHAMVTAAVWWVIVSSLGSFLAVCSAPYVLYVVMLVAVGISRIFILAHFPHQVVAGSITGLNTYYAKIIFLKKAGHFIKTLMLHAGLKQLGIDLSWSIALAKKWCSHAEWIRLDTAPFSSLTRDCGALLGLGLAQYWKPGGWSLPWAPRALSMAVSSMGLYHVNRLPLPVRPLGLFYSLFFVKFVLVPLIVMVLVPGLMSLPWTVRADAGTAESEPSCL
uniref:glucose-6-phosphatase n=1 Tax=Pundamilia nyererei TaxID=303518 RepID=A0A3B4H7Q4_9CICH